VTEKLIRDVEDSFNYFPLRIFNNEYLFMFHGAIRMGMMPVQNNKEVTALWSMGQRFLS